MKKNLTLMLIGLGLISGIPSQAAYKSKTLKEMAAEIRDAMKDMSPEEKEEYIKTSAFLENATPRTKQEISKEIQSAMKGMTPKQKEEYIRSGAFLKKDIVEKIAKEESKEEIKEEKAIDEDKKIIVEEEDIQQEKEFIAEKEGIQQEEIKSDEFSEEIKVAIQNDLNKFKDLHNAAVDSLKLITDFKSDKKENITVAEDLIQQAIKIMKDLEPKLKNIADNEQLGDRTIGYYKKLATNLTKPETGDLVLFEKLLYQLSTINDEIQKKTTHSEKYKRAYNEIRTSTAREPDTTEGDDLLTEFKRIEEFLPKPTIKEKIITEELETEKKDENIKKETPEIKLTGLNKKAIKGIKESLKIFQEQHKVVLDKLKNVRNIEKDTYNLTQAQRFNNNSIKNLNNLSGKLQNIDDNQKIDGKTAGELKKLVYNLIGKDDTKEHEGDLLYIQKQLNKLTTMANNKITSEKYKQAYADFIKVEQLTQSAPDTQEGASALLALQEIAKLLPKPEYKKEQPNEEIKLEEEKIEKNQLTEDEQLKALTGKVIDKEALKNIATFDIKDLSKIKVGDFILLQNEKNDDDDSQTTYRLVEVSIVNPNNNNYLAVDADPQQEFNGFRSEEIDDLNKIGLFSTSTTPKQIIDAFTK